VFYFHPDADGIGGPRDITRELHGERHHSELPAVFFEKPQWRSWQPIYPAAIAPLLEEPDFPKASKDGFETTTADYYLKTWGIDTLIAVGFALRSCLYHTCLGARHRNYRVIMLRDCTTPPGSGEFPDTKDASNPEGGWMRLIFLRQFETTIGYTSTSGEFQQACAAI
jgi:nicotinamidase-related amidase